MQTESHTPTHKTTHTHAHRTTHAGHKEEGGGGDSLTHRFIWGVGT